MRIAVQGCAHGELERVYGTLAEVERRTGVRTDLLVCCGDFQAARDARDMESMAVPPKYRRMGSFYKYYTGELVAPVLTLFIGGNHEASAHLQELSYGGWAAPGIYYLGTAGVVNVGGVRIAGLSGIYKGGDYARGRHERPPYDERTKRSVYHVRQLDVFRLKQLREPVDVMLSHDWPQGIEQHGDLGQLLRFKPFFQNDIDEGKLGNPPARELLNILRPTYWFSAHLHCKYAAVVDHSSDDDQMRKQTKFLSLDKCLPGRRFLQVLDIAHDASGPIRLQYDAEWLAVLRSTNGLLNVNSNVYYLPSGGGAAAGGPSSFDGERYDFSPSPQERSAVLGLFDDGSLAIPENFVSNDAYRRGVGVGAAAAATTNPQTEAFCRLLGVDDPLALVLGGRRRAESGGPTAADRLFAAFDDDYSMIPDDDDDYSKNPDDDDGDGVVVVQRNSTSLVLPEPKNDRSEDASCAERNRPPVWTPPPPPDAKNDENSPPESDCRHVEKDESSRCRSDALTGGGSGGDGDDAEIARVVGSRREDEAVGRERIEPKTLKRRNYHREDDGGGGSD
ncbi:uncharacterized protein LOC126897389 [Daktulosphaira vitifoliae]|uniref:uncharacterized protein LOC126897389 n=1 Tax=Daktulosphaira vitifoliae TaxID=58002 RepID=UPI0021AAE991|nr:uncharacterized protein LOC126897389 [Daktulosphaira vitifoliae]